MHRPSRILPFLFAALILAPALARAETKRRPRVALVLSGGGARGMAHIGVLKALEELHIPVDYVAGTSMGAVIGGLYASGMSPEEIERWAREVDWSFLMSDIAPRESESPRHKQREFDLNQNLQLEVNRKDGVKMPAGAIQGRNIIAAFRELTAPVRNVRDFDRLPIPYRAVAADISTGDLVVRRNGHLAEAIRASMAAPAVFAPLTIDGKLLVDGGIASNLPVRVAQEWGPDLIIAVDASPRLLPAEQLDDARKIAEQMIAILIQKETKKDVASLGPQDLYLRLEVQDIGPTEFPKGAKSIDRGYDRAMEKKAALAHFATSQAEYDRFLSAQRIPRQDGVPVAFLQVHTPLGSTEHALSKPLKLSTLRPAEFAPLQRTIADLPEMQRYEVADYEVVDKDGETGLRVIVRERKTGKNVVSLGLDFAYSSNGETDANFLLAYRMTELNRLGAEWTTYLSIGDSNRASTEWYQPLDPGRVFFVAPHGGYANEFIDGTDGNGQPIRFRLQTISAGVDLGVRLSQVGEFRLGIARGVSRSGRHLGNLDDLEGTIERGWAHADLVYDTMEARSFSTRGSYARISLAASREELGADDNYTRLDAELHKAISFGKNTIVPRITAGLKLGGSALPIYDRPSLGGFLHLSGLAKGDLYDQNALFAELIYYRKIAEMSPAVGRGIYLGFSLEAGDVAPSVNDIHFDDAVYGGSVFIGADTLFGPIHLGVGIAEGGESAVYLQLGPMFSNGQQRRW